MIVNRKIFTKASVYQIRVKIYDLHKWYSWSNGFVGIEIFVVMLKWKWEACIDKAWKSTVGRLVVQEVNEKSISSAISDSSCARFSEEVDGRCISISINCRPFIKLLNSQYSIGRQGKKMISTTVNYYLSLLKQGNRSKEVRRWKIVNICGNDWSVFIQVSQSAWNKCGLPFFLPYWNYHRCCKDVIIWAKEAIEWMWKEWWTPQNTVVQEPCSTMCTNWYRGKSKMQLLESVGFGIHKWGGVCLDRRGVVLVSGGFYMYWGVNNYSGRNFVHDYS